MSTRVNFVRGLFGMGVVIMISTNTSRVIFDFGAPFDPLGQIYDGTVLARNKNRLKDSLLLNQAPLLDYVYPKANLQDIGLKPSEDNPYQTAIFISHCHKDHMSEIDKVDPSIPVYLHSQGLKLKKALEDIDEEKKVRDYSGFEYETAYQIGDIKVTPYFSDHTCIGSAGFLIQTSDSRIYYSGDIRFHGLQAGQAWQEIEKFNQNIDLLIVDSTTTSASEFIEEEFSEQQLKTPSKTLFAGMISEQNIYDDVSSKLSQCKGLGIFNLYHRDIRMLEKMMEIAENNKRTAVFEPETAYIINQLLGKTVSVILPETANYPDFYQQVIQQNNIVDKQAILFAPNRYFLQNSYRNILELTDYSLEDGIYFHLFGEPLTTKEKHYTIMRNILDKLNCEYFSHINLYSFSHAYPNHLAYFIQQVNPNMVVAVHSRHPENLNPVNSQHIIPKEKVSYLLVDGQLIENNR